MRVESLMNREVKFCRENDNLNTAAKIMWDADVGCVPVLNADDELIGMLTDRDVCMATYTQGRLLADLPVSSHMAKQVYSCPPDASLEEAESMMRDRQIRRLPVVDHDGCMVGIISLNDIAREVGGPRRRRSDVTAEEVATTLSAICQPRHPAFAPAAVA